MSGSSCVRHSEFFKTTTFRWAIAFALAFSAGAVLLAVFIYWQTVGYLMRRQDAELLERARAIATASPARQSQLIRRYLGSEDGRGGIAGVFDASGRPLAGDLPAVPSGLPHSPTVGVIQAPIEISGRSKLVPLRAVALPGPRGETAVLGRNPAPLDEIDEIVTRALLLALVPTVALALAGGALLSRGAIRRIAAVHRASRVIMSGRLGERLPTRGTHDAFDQLVRVVNEMLAEIERLMSEAKGVGEDIAHDLRTPLTRLRGKIEKTVALLPPTSEPAGTLGAAIDDIEQILGTITAILRIAEVEHGQRRAGFRDVNLADVVREAADLYDPIAEEKAIALTIHDRHPGFTRGDGDLLFEAVANLLENAIKFTPSGGRVEVSLQQCPEGPSIRVVDTGPGIPAADFPRVLRRFHRADPSRHTPGAGLGLSLVASIVRLHGFRLILRQGSPGCSIELECWPHDGNSSTSTGGFSADPH